MPSALVSLSSRHARIAVAAVLCVLAPALAAQETPDGAAPVGDPGMIIARTVNPRIAYRGVPTEANPIHTEATLFPARTFHAAIDGTIGELLGDEALGARGSAGIHAGAVAGAAIGRTFFGDASPLGPSPGAGAALGPAATSIGPGGVVGGAVSRAVSGGGATGFGGRFGAMPTAMPTQQGGGP